MRYPKCPYCEKGFFIIKNTKQVDGLTYRRKECNTCQRSIYTESREITREKWREATTRYEKKKALERERRRESGS